MNYHIITGTSRGIGAAVALDLVAPETVLFCISRGTNKELIEKAARAGCPLHYFQQDLGDITALDTLMHTIFSNIDPATAKTITLINNAGILGSVGPTPTNTSEAIQQILTINTAVPMALSSGFVRMFKNVPCRKVIINISSGAARRPIWGWSAYCSSKAALDMYTQTVALEEKDSRFPVRIYAFAPGVVDTSMQEKIRKTAPHLFKDREHFINYHREGQLLEPKIVAEKIISLIHDNSIKNGALLHI